ncbi:unnamed protein product [Cercopithifilaria johnstoni]|uniref:Uncharacterized protein n=1 Tax=Cercopithifilaria johnstoni TaxID=2874296 RepID=A0A8J2MRX3_9BILA|nr:unnamed protein product [Cercopithifilaria johnstoni]
MCCQFATAVWRMCRFGGYEFLANCIPAIKMFLQAYKMVYEQFVLQFCSLAQGCCVRKRDTHFARNLGDLPKLVEVQNHLSDPRPSISHS